MTAALEPPIARLRCVGTDVKWSDPRQTHLTLKFLGDTPRDRLETIAAQMTRVAHRHAPLALRLGQVGAFPDARRPRVIWLGLEGDLEPLRRLHADLEEALASEGIARDERPFHPHLTLGRVRSPRHLEALVQEMRRMADAATIERVSWRADHLILFQSTLTPTGPIYQPLETAVMSATASPD